MPITELRLTNFRNFSNMKCELSPGVNVFVGDNGSGKTSLVEALHLLGTARSFRSNSARHYISLEQTLTTLFAKIQRDEQQLALGLQRLSNGKLTIKLNGETYQRSVLLARTLPLLLVNETSFRLFDESPNIRRQAIDWGVFHVEHSYYEIWRNYTRLLKQRNSALKNKDMALVKSWDKQLIYYAEQVDDHRQRYLTSLQTHLAPLCDEFFYLSELEINYQSGWKNDKTFATALTDNLAIDVKYGTTQSGPHRADLQVKSKGREIKHLLSRGQIKVFSVLFKLAQLRQLLSDKSLDCLILIDDLVAELDNKNLLKLITLFSQLQQQMIVTTTSEQLFSEFSAEQIRWFHVEHNQVKQTTYN